MIATLIVTTLLAAVGGDTAAPVVLRSAGHSFVLHVPEGTEMWTVEKDGHSSCGPVILPPADRNQGMVACIVGGGGRPRSISYVCVDGRDGSTSKLLNASARMTLSQYAAITPDITVLRWEDAKTGTGKTVPVAVCHIYDGYEVVAFIGERSAVVRIGTRVREIDGGCPRALDILRTIVASYAASTD